MSVHFVSREFTAKEVQAVLRALCGGTEKIGLALLNYYARTNLVPSTGKSLNRGRYKYTYPDLILLCWLFRMKREGLPVNRFRRGLDYLRKKLPRLLRNPEDMLLLTDGKQLFLKHRVEEKNDIAEALTGTKAGQYVWVYAIGSLIEEIDQLIENSAAQTLEKTQNDSCNSETNENNSKGVEVQLVRVA
jgi:DNA-binding transcriptional MerR regulator